MLTRAHFGGMVGQRIVCCTQSGVVHHGILHSVTNQGIYLRPLRGAAVVSNPNGERNLFEILGDVKSDSTDVEQVWLPFLFLPFLALAWAYPWGLYW